MNCSKVRAANREDERQMVRANRARLVTFTYPAARGPARPRAAREALKAAAGGER